MSKSASKTAVIPQQRNETPDRPYWLTEPCPAWCLPETHRDGWGVERVHFGPEVEVTLTTEDYEDPRDTEPPSVSIYIQQELRAVEPIIAVEHNERMAFELTLDEAERVAGHLLDMVRAARANTVPCAVNA